VGAPPVEILVASAATSCIPGEDIVFSSCSCDSNGMMNMRCNGGLPSGPDKNLVMLYGFTSVGIPVFSWSNFR